MKKADNNIKLRSSMELKLFSQTACKGAQPNQAPLPIGESPMAEFNTAL